MTIAAATSIDERQECPNARSCDERPTVSRFAPGTALANVSHCLMGCTVRLAASLATVALLASCASLPSQEGRVATTALADTAGTRLGLAVAPAVATHPGRSGIHALPSPRDAFAARALLAASAEKSLDVQYYIWRDDQVGGLLFDSIRQAADRGVRVRLLLDDMNTRGLDPIIAALDDHPNIEVRLYNPFAWRGARVGELLTDFARLNRRMHNKSFTADGQVSIVGGRNIANEYFGAGTELVFADLDVIAVGEVARDVSREFDLYWNSPSAYPAAGLVGVPGPDGIAAVEARLARSRADPESLAFVEAVRATPLIAELLDGRLALEWTHTKLLYDDPAKTLDTTPRTDVLLFTELMRTIGRPDRSLDLISPYFVPGDGGTEALVRLAASGVTVRILTNSLSSSESTAVHSGYAKRRPDLLRAGVRLYEFKASAAREAREEQDKARFGSSSTSGLHAKTFAVDRTRIFVGSFNFDLRSALLNTEMGLVIDSPTLAQRLAAQFDSDVRRVAYEVRLRPDGMGIQWVEWTQAGEIVHDTEPGAGWLQRFNLEVLSILPIDWLL